ncbi:hypothetical protein ACFQ2T_08140 [Methylophilus flavus]|uniref:Uncharacterized protein n=1 Tax=Methylophilus flavus TaxID=640084 RepID=A0ABW3PAB9_9PROT
MQKIAWRGLYMCEVQVFLTYQTMANENPPMDAGGLFKATNGINN